MTAEERQPGEHADPDWEAKYWKQTATIALVLKIALAASVAFAVVTVVLVPFDTVLPYHRLSGRVSVLVLALPPIPLIGTLVRMRKPPKGVVTRAGRIGAWVLLLPFVAAFLGMQLYLCIQFLIAGGVLGS